MSGVLKLDWYAHNPRHSSVRVFSGPDRDHLALAGNLTFDREEATYFRSTIMLGADMARFRAYSIVLESGWENRDS